MVINHRIIDEALSKALKGKRSDKIPLMSEFLKEFGENTQHIEMWALCYIKNAELIDKWVELKNIKQLGFEILTKRQYNNDWRDICLLALIAKKLDIEGFNRRVYIMTNYNDCYCENCVAGSLFMDDKYKDRFTEILESLKSD